MHLHELLHLGSNDIERLVDSMGDISHFTLLPEGGVDFHMSLQDPELIHDTSIPGFCAFAERSRLRRPINKTTAHYLHIRGPVLYRKYGTKTPVVSVSENRITVHPPQYHVNADNLKPLCIRASHDYFCQNFEHFRHDFVDETNYIISDLMRQLFSTRQNLARQTVSRA